MELIEPEPLRLLRYLAACEPSGIYSVLLDEFGKGTPKLLGFPQRMMPTESWSNCLLRIGWAYATKDSRIRITPIGRDVLRNAAAEATGSRPEPELDQVLLTTDDKLAYPKLLAGILNLGPALLVDPYLRAEQFLEVADATQVSRYLIGSKMRKEDRGLICTALGQLPETDRPEIRESGALHDRLAIADSGTVLAFGLSLNGVGRKTTAMVTLAKQVAHLISTEYEAIWNSSTPIEDDSQ